MKLAWLNLRYTTDERARLFHDGLKRLGYKPVRGVPGRHENADLFITWNRIGVADQAAQRMEQAELPVLVAENASWGNKFAGDYWYHIAKGRHNTQGRFDYGGPERWDQLDIELKPYRPANLETVILLQRGIGSNPTRSPLGFLREALEKYPTARIRHHPGQKKKSKPLLLDLENVSRVVTWGSGAAIIAAMEGISVDSYMPNWVGAHLPDELERLNMLRRLAWCQWRHSEIESGEALRRLGA